MKKYFFLIFLFASVLVHAQSVPNYIYGKDVIISMRDTSSAELTIKNSTRTVTGFLKNIGGGKTTFKVLDIADVTGLQTALNGKLSATITTPSTGHLIRYNGSTWVNWSPTFLDISDTAAMLSSRWLGSRTLDSLTAIQARIQSKQPLGSYLEAGNNLADVTNIVTARYNIGLGNVPNVDATNASNISSGTLDDARLTSNVTLQGNSFNGVNQLVKTGGDGKLPAGVLPSLAITETFTVASQAAMLALAAQTGDVAVRTDEQKTYILAAEPATTLANWVWMQFPDAENDPIYTASSWYSTTNNSSNWNTAYSWGNWAAGSHYIGTTLIANNRASASQSLTGVSIDGTAGSETLATITGRGASTSTAVTFNGGLSATTGTLSGLLKITAGTISAGTELSLAWDATNGASIQSFSSKPLNLNPLGNEIFLGGSLYGITGIFSSIIQSTGGDFRSTKAPSDSYSVGPFYQWSNVGNTRNWLVQLNTSLGLDFWFYDGATTSVKATLGYNTGLSINNPAGGQATFYGSSDFLSGRPGSGKIALGSNALYQGILQYYDGGTTVLYIDNSYDHPNSKIVFRARTTGTPVEIMEMRGDGSVGINGFSSNSISFYPIYSGSPTNAGMQIKNYSGSVTFDHNSNGGLTYSNKFAAGGTLNRNFWELGIIRLAASDELHLLDITSSTTEIVLASNYYGGGSYKPMRLTVNPPSYPNQLLLNTDGSVTIQLLAGSGNRIVYVNSSGKLASMVIGSGLSFDGTTLSATGGSSGTVTGSGTSGIIPIWNSASDIGNSVMSQSGGNITISGELRVNGIIRDYQGEALLQTSGSTTMIGSSGATTPRGLSFYAGNTIAYTVSASTLAAVFNGSVTASSFIVAGGSSSNILRADGGQVWHTSANTANSLVYRDASGNFSAGTITATLNGNAATATTATYANNWNSYNQSLITSGIVYVMTYNGSGWGYSSAGSVQGWLGLGSYAYRSSGLAELSGASFTGNISTTGTITASGGGFNSDLTLKKIIAINPQTDIADKVTLIKHSWVNKQAYGDGEYYGYGAQWIQSILPEAVYTNESTGKLAVNYTMVHSVILNEHTREINELKSEIITLKKMLNEIRN